MCPNAVGFCGATCGFTTGSAFDLVRATDKYILQHSSGSGGPLAMATAGLTLTGVVKAVYRHCLQQLFLAQQYDWLLQ
jgi:hypothetical protein